MRHIVVLRGRLRHTAALTAVVVLALAGCTPPPSSAPSPTSSRASPSPVATTPASPGTATAPPAGTLYVAGIGRKILVIPPGAASAQTVVKVAVDGGSLVVAPAGTPNAGTVYVTNRSPVVSVIAPGASTATRIRLGSDSGATGFGFPRIAPAGTPEAGALYITDATDKTVLVVPPGATSPQTVIPVGNDPGGLVIAPAGTPNAGTVYVVNYDDKTMSVIAPGAVTATTVTLKDPGGYPSPVIAPAGTPNAGTLYIPNWGHTMSVIAPGATTATTVRIANPTKLAPGPVVIAPAGTPRAGTVYIPSEGGVLSVLAPGATRAHTITVALRATYVDVVPSDARKAGTVYLLSGVHRGTVSVIPPRAARVTAIFGTGRSPNPPVMAPAGTPEAGTYFVTDNGGRVISVVPPGGTSVQSRIRLPAMATPPMMAPAGLPTGGTLYVPITNRIWVVPPGATTACSIAVGKAGADSLAFAPGDGSSSSGGGVSVCPSGGSSSRTSSPGAAVSHVLVLATDGAIRDGDGNAMPTSSQKAADQWLTARVGVLNGAYAGSFGRLSLDFYHGYHGWVYGDSYQAFTPHLASTNHLLTDTGVGLGTTYQQVLSIYPSLSKVAWTSSGGWIDGKIPGTDFLFSFTGGANGSDMEVPSGPPSPTAKVVTLAWLPSR